MISIGSARTPTTYQDRTVYAQRLAHMSGGEQTFEEVTSRLEDSDRLHLWGAETAEAFYSGKLTPVKGTNPENYANALAQAREARRQHYNLKSGPVLIEAMNIDSAVKAQSTMTGGDLKDLVKYADYLRNEVAAASKVRTEVSFSGTWGKNRITTDVNEYVSWLYQAAQGKSPEAG